MHYYLFNMLLMNTLTSVNMILFFKTPTNILIAVGTSENLTEDDIEKACHGFLVMPPFR